MGHAGAGAVMPCKNGVHVSERAISCHVDFARQRFLSGTAVVDDATLGLCLFENLCSGDRTCGRGNAQEVMASAVAPRSVCGAAVG